MIWIMTSRTRSKSLSDDENTRLREVLRKHLLPRYDGNQSSAGPALGISQAGLSRILAGGGASLATAHAVAKVLGTSVADVLGWPVTDVSVKSSPRFGDLAAWKVAEAEARRLYGDVLPAFAFDRAANTKGGAHGAPDEHRQPQQGEPKNSHKPRLSALSTSTLLKTC
jgi:hypothetical protein